MRWSQLAAVAVGAALAALLAAPPAARAQQPGPDLGTDEQRAASGKLYTQ